MRSNNTNKLSPQELTLLIVMLVVCSNNTNKLSPQELLLLFLPCIYSSNNTNKLSPQEPAVIPSFAFAVQIIQINLVLKNTSKGCKRGCMVQIIQINLVLKNESVRNE